MTIAELMIAEMKHEAVTTKKILQLVPMEKAEWQPHGKSSRLGRLAKHIADIPSWVQLIIPANEFDLANGFGKPTNPTTANELVMIFEDNNNTAIDFLANTTDDALGQLWTLRHGDHIIFTMPKVITLRNMVLNHIVHHRAQLGVFLRLLDISIPGSYGPSADDVPPKA